MSIYTIEKSVPLPSKRQRIIYPFPDMQIGDSFSVPSSKYQNLNGAARAYEKKNPGTKFTTRKMQDNEIRIWRVQ